MSICENCIFDGQDCRLDHDECKSLQELISDNEKLASALDKMCERVSRIQGGGTKEDWRKWAMQND